MEGASQLARHVKGEPENWEAVINGLRAVAQWPNGTAKSSFRSANYDPGGKTGSAQTAPGQPAHGWFASLAPASKPEIVVVVFAEYGEGGASAAAPIARQVFDAYFKAKAAREAMAKKAAAKTSPSAATKKPTESSKTTIPIVVAPPTAAELDQALGQPSD
jgi:hypothetical protein